MCRQNHGVAVDYYAVGVIAYECMMGRVNWKEKKNNRILIFNKSKIFKYFFIETISWKIEKGNKRPNFG